MPKDLPISSYKAYIASQFQTQDDEFAVEQRLPFVTISRKAGAGGITIGEKLCEYLRQHDKNAKTCPWTVFDKNLVEQVIKDHNLPEKVARFMSEDKMNEVEDILEELFRIHPSKWTLVHKTTQTILHLAEMGHVILVGRGANVITRKLTYGFHVRLVGSISNRIEYMMEKFHLSEKQAIHVIKKRDQGRENYLKKYFGKDIDDPLLYDLVINTDHISCENAAQFIGEAVLNLAKTMPSQKIIHDTYSANLI